MKGRDNLVLIKKFIITFLFSRKVSIPMKIQASRCLLLSVTCLCSVLQSDTYSDFNYIVD